MLDKRLKWAFFVVVAIFAGLPIGGIILDVLKPSNIQVDQPDGEAKPSPGTVATAVPMKEDMVFIPAGEFVRGYNDGGFDEKPEGLIMLDAYWIDRHEVTYGAYIGRSPAM